MTSKISFFKLMKEDMKRRSWLAAALWLACFIVMPVALMIRLDSLSHLYSEGNLGQGFQYIVREFQDWVGAGNAGVMLLVLAAAVAAGISGYAYLHSSVRLDFYHSLPIPRKKLFFVQYVSGIIMFALPYICCMLLCLGIGAANGFLTKAIAILALKMIFYHLINFLAVYGTVILGMMMTGKALTAILGMIVFAIYIPGVIMVLQGMKSMFYETYVQGGIFAEHSALLSPAFAGWYAETMFNADSQAGKWYLIGIVVMIFWTLVMTGFAIWLCQVRKTEAAEHSMAFPKTEGAVKVLIVIPLSLAVGLYLQDIVSTESSYWFYIGIVGALILLSALIEFIYHLNMKEIFRHKLQILLAGAVTLAIALCFRYDVTGYDSYLPAKEDLAQMALYDSGVNGGFYYASDGGDTLTYSAVAALDVTLVDDFDEIYTLAEKAARGNAEDESRTRSIYIEYRQKSGKREIRTYYMSDADVDAAYETLFENQKFVNSIYPMMGAENDTIDGLAVEGAFGGEELEIEKTKREEFLEIYREELRSVSYDDIQNHMIATLRISRTITEEVTIYGTSEITYSEDGYPICESFTKTIAFLQDELGVDVNRTLTADDVANIYISDYRDDESGGESKSITVTDEEQIREILDCLTYTPIYSMAVDAENIYVDVTLRSGSYVNGRFYFKKGSVPKILSQ